MFVFFFVFVCLCVCVGVCVREREGREREEEKKAREGGEGSGVGGRVRGGEDPLPRTRVDEINGDACIATSVQPSRLCKAV